MRPCLFLGLGLLLIQGCGAPDGPPKPSKPPLSLLFIGNSLTFVNDLPGALKAIAAAEGRVIRVQSRAVGGWTLALHDADPQTNALILRGGWDYVVLQEQSRLSVDNYPGFAAAAASLDAKIRAAGARTLLYQNWPCQSQPQRFQDYHDAFGNVAAQLNAGWVRAGDAWGLVHQDQPGTWAQLYGDDVHPSAKGSYLTACVFYDVLYGDSPAQADPVLGQSAADSAYLQAKAWAVAGPAPTPVPAP